MHINEIKPDIIEVDQGANALTYFQAININKIFSIRAKMCFFTWMNKPYANPFPFNIIEKYNLKNTDMAICGNNDAKLLLIKKGYTRQITTMPLLGVDTKKFSKNNKTRECVRKKLGINDKICIGFFGRLVVEKGIDDLIKAVYAAQNKKLKLLIIGNGPEKNNLEKLVNDFQMQNQVIFIERVLHDELPAYYTALDIFVLPSKTVPWWREQFGHVVIEAMAAEVPVIGSTCGEIPTLIDNAGIVFEEGNVEQLKKEILKLIEDKNLRKHLGKLGKNRVLTNYTHKILADKLFKMYKTML